MKEAGFTFEVRKPDIDESWPDHVPIDAVARYLAEKKANVYAPSISNEIVVAADTVVILKNEILNKPDDREHAIEMLTRLSDRTHRVTTGVCILSKERKVVFDDTTEVTFNPLKQQEIEYYVDTFKPFDKAGSYGAQDWIGMVALKEIKGSYFNVMGLPIHKVFQLLKDWR
jgi:septum formation protein